METGEHTAIIYEKDGPIARIILNRPEAANAQSSDMVWEVEAALKDAQNDYGIKVVIFKANGKGFCSGHDLNPEPGKMPYEEFQESADAGYFMEGTIRLFLWPVLNLLEFQKPTVCAVNGYCIGGGTYFALSNDIVIASEDAYFQMPLPQGFALPGGETMIEPWNFMNMHRTYEYLYLSSTLNAEEAKAQGLVNRVVPRDQLELEAEIVARQIAEAPLSVLMNIKAGVKAAFEGMGMRNHIQGHLPRMQVCSDSADTLEWRKENVEKGYGFLPRKVVTARNAHGEEEARARFG